MFSNAAEPEEFLAYALTNEWVYSAVKDIKIKPPKDNEGNKDDIDTWVADVLPKTDAEGDADILSDDENNFAI